MVDDLNELSGHPEDASGIVVFLLSLITCNIYSLFWLYNAGKKTAEVDGVSDDSVLYLILALFGFSIVDYCLIQDKINKNASRINVVDM